MRTICVTILAAARPMLVSAAFGGVTSDVAGMDAVGAYSFVQDFEDYGKMMDMLEKNQWNAAAKDGLVLVPTARGSVKVRASGKMLAVETPVPARVAWDGRLYEVDAGKHQWHGDMFDK